MSSPSSSWRLTLTASLERVCGLDAGAFIDEYLAPGRPVVVTDGMVGWSARERWTWAYLDASFGEREVELYGDGFEPTGVARFGDVLDEIVGTGHSASTHAFVRLFSRLQPGPGPWADDVFDALSDDWRQPAFLPKTDYVVPAVSPPDTADAASAAFPFRSVLVSAVGGRTRLHVDPWASSAILCQIVGRKHVALHRRERDAMLRKEAGNGARTTDLAPDIVGELRAGEVLYIPGRWWHEVTTLDASVSLTWNFVHRATAHELTRYVAEHADDPLLTVAEYFAPEALT